jgi:hypothetical protein
MNEFQQKLFYAVSHLCTTYCLWMMTDSRGDWKGTKANYDDAFTQYYDLLLAVTGDKGASKSLLTETAPESFTNPALVVQAIKTDYFTMEQSALKANYLNPVNPQDYNQ